jgi:hypothetical protein
MPARTFQDVIQTLNRYWGAQGCVLLQPLDTEVGAGTFHPATFLRALGPEPCPGPPPTCNHRAVPPTGATARTPTAFSTITSTRW